MAFLALANAHAARAECSSGGIGYFPEPGSELPTNAMIVVSGVGNGRSTIDWVAEVPMELKGREDSSALSVYRVLHSARGEAAVFLRTSTELVSGETYELHGMVGMERQVNMLWKGQARPRWIAGKGPDGEAPRWINAPQLVGTEYKMFGCGPSVGARIQVDVLDGSPLVFLVKLRRNGPSGDPEVYWNLLNRGVLFVGHGMCYGEFDLRAGEMNWVELTAVDLAGNEKAAPGGPIRFNTPGPPERKHR